MQQTPMMRQYHEVKSQYPGMILLFRMGDFYEMFNEDAQVAARVLGLTLTSRSKGEAAVPMAGIPYHSVQTYLKKLILAGHKVAVCDQIEDPRTAKGLVERDVTRVITPGTVTEDTLLESNDHNYLAAVFFDATRAGISWVELSTGRFCVEDCEISRLGDELARLNPSEMLLPESAALDESPFICNLRRETAAMITHRPEWTFGRDTASKLLMEHFRVASLDGFGCENLGLSLSAAGAALQYLQETQKVSLGHIQRLWKIAESDHVMLDRATVNSLELTRTMREGERKGTLLEVLDRTQTNMGSRLMKDWLLSPLRAIPQIHERQDGVEELLKAHAVRKELRALLREVYDVERLTARVATGRANARDLLALRKSLEPLPSLKERLLESFSGRIRKIAEQIDPVDEVRALIGTAIAADPPVSLKEGGLIRDGYSAELDELRSIQRDGKAWIARFQARESERTKIPSLKVGYNQVFGYYIEVTNSHQEKIPADYVRKQTLKNAERYITPDLKEYETKVLTAQERSCGLEYDIFVKVRDEASRYTQRLQATAQILAELDALSSLADAAAEFRYVRPQVDESRSLEIREGRHPALERAFKEPFVPNDTLLDGDSTHIMIITGPNMAGKSTYIRQTALITLMAHIGSFVPAASARIGLVDRIFTRVGASDEISRGQSTFMVEMVETANILNNATDRSLIILDEVGRGTSTFDGVSIAWAVAEYLAQRVKSRTLFATHYHELTELASLFDNIRNYNIAVREWQDEIIFLRRIVEGGADKSYGIHVSRLAGVPREVVERAKTILANLENASLDEQDKPRLAMKPGRKRKRSDGLQLTIFGAEADLIAEMLRQMNISSLTPIEALNKLEELKKIAEKR